MQPDHRWRTAPENHGILYFALKVVETERVQLLEAGC